MGNLTACGMYQPLLAAAEVSANPMDWDDYDMQNISTVFFNRFDINTDGEVSLLELHAMIKTLNRETQVFSCTSEELELLADIIMEDNDMDGNGVLDADEFVSFFSASVLVPLFKRKDGDHVKDRYLRRVRERKSNSQEAEAEFDSMHAGVGMEAAEGGPGGVLRALGMASSPSDSSFDPYDL